MNRQGIIAGIAAIAVLSGHVPSVMAHPGHEMAGLAAGLAHPWLGWDHVLAMLAVGLWASTQQGLARWWAPTAFVGGLVLGLVLGATSGVPVVEALIVGSLVISGLLLRVQPTVHLASAVLLFAVLGAAHGWAHRIEMPESASLLPFLVGMGIASALLHLLGMGLALSLHRFRRGGWLGWIGALIAASGALTAVGG